MNSFSTDEKQMIVDGVKAIEGRYPYIVSLANDRRVGCAGTLINPQWVLSAAHCSKEGVDVDDVTQVIIGHHDLRAIPDDAEIIGIDYMIPHPHFSRFQNDVLLIKLKSPSISGSAVQLDFGDIDLTEGLDVTVLGWGREGKGLPRTDVLYEAELDIVDLNTCDEAYARDTDGNAAIIETMICASREEKGPCHGDSGGPLIIKGSTPDEDIQVGIVSFGKGCGRRDYPGVYQRVSKFYNFIYHSVENEVGNPNFNANVNVNGGCLYTSLDDGLNYSTCIVENSCWIGDGYCDEGLYNSIECNYDGGDCLADICLFPDDEFDYTNCTVQYPCWIKDSYCDGGPWNTSECNFDGADCLYPSPFPNDGFDYSKCDAPYDKIGDGICDVRMSTTKCNFDGGDCLACPFPDDGFNYTSCDAYPCWIGDTMCDKDPPYNTMECNNDGLDCSKCHDFHDFPNDGFNYTTCKTDFPCMIGDGVCNAFHYTQECNLDGGDCQSCLFPEDGFDYSYSTCDVQDLCSLGDGLCDRDWPSFTEDCNHDGGDCSICEFPDDGFDYSDCKEYPCDVGNGICYSYLNIAQCNYDGGDCILHPISQLFSNLLLTIGLLKSIILSIAEII